MCVCVCCVGGEEASACAINTRTRAVPNPSHPTRTRTAAPSPPTFPRPVRPPPPHSRAPAPQRGTRQVGAHGPARYYPMRRGSHSRGSRAPAILMAFLHAFLVFPGVGRAREPGLLAGRASAARAGRFDGVFACFGSPSARARERAARATVRGTLARAGRLLAMAAAARAWHAHTRSRRGGSRGARRQPARKKKGRKRMSLPMRFDGFGLGAAATRDR